MKKFLAIALFLLLGVGMQHAAQAQVRMNARQNVVKVNPLSLGLLTFNASYERVLTERVSLQLGAFFTGISLQGTSISGLGITPEVRVYMSKSTGGAPEGWYISPFFRYQTLEFSAHDAVTDSKANAEITAVGGGAVAGYQWLLGKADRVTLDLFIGPKYDIGNTTYSGNASEENFSGIGNFSGFWIRSGLTLGIAF